MSVFLVARAIKARLDADTGSGGLLNAGSAFKLTGVYFSRGSIGTQTYPYAIITAQTTGEDAMSMIGAEVSWTITVYDAAENGDTKLWPILNRIYGDWILNTPQRPTYGLHAHELVLDTNSTRNPFAVTGAEVLVDGHDYGEAEDTPACIALQVRGRTRYQR